MGRKRSRDLRRVSIDEFPMDGRNIGVVLMEQIIKGLDEIFCNVIIAVNKGDVRTGCRIQSHIPGIGLAAVFLMDDPDACVPLCPCITECRAVIGRTIIDQDHLKVRICLGQNAGDTPVQIGLYFIYRNTMGKAILQLRAQGEPDGFLYSDEALFSKSIQRPMVAHFKPDYAPDYLLCCNYICHLAVFQKALWDEIGGERPECDGSQDHDLFLRLVEKTGGAAHVPQVLYYWRVHAGSTSGGTDAKPYVAAAAKKALADHLARTGRTGTVEDGLFPSTYRVKWDIVGDPKVSILIPNKDHTDDLEKCLHSIWTKTSWENFEVIVIENNSTDPATFTYYKEARQRYDGLQVVNYPQKGFNFSGINNFGRQYASGDYLLLLNNDVEARNADWLTELLRQCAHPGGAAICGAELLYPDETLQHAGVVTGLGGYAGHSHKYRKAGGSGYMFRAATVQDFSAVTGACLLVKTSVWDEVGGLDEAFAVAFNDVDFCLRVRDAGYRIAWTPYAQLTHYESKSRGGDEKDPVKARRFAAEQQRLYAVHGKANILHDPYYNPNLTMDREDFSESDDLRGLKEGRITVQWRE